MVSISHSPFGKGVENGNTSILVEPSGGRTESFTSSNILENLSFPNSGPVLNPTGKTTTYYLNFFEAVNESKNNKTSTGDGSLIFKYVIVIVLTIDIKPSSGLDIFFSKLGTV